MNLALLRPTVVAAGPAAGPAGSAPVIASAAAALAPGAAMAVTGPRRAAFGPHVSLVSVDDHGRLWVRFSTAIVMMLAAVALMLIPLCAGLWVGDGLVSSGQVSFTGHAAHPASETRGPASSGPTQLPLADHSAR